MWVLSFDFEYLNFSNINLTIHMSGLSYFSLLFFSRSYGINFSADTYDDAPGYYVWFKSLRQNAIFEAKK